MRKHTQPNGQTITVLDWSDVDEAAEKLAKRHKDLGHVAVYGIPTGGSVIAPLVAKYLNVPVSPWVRGASLIVDDLVDSGRTLSRMLTSKGDSLHACSHVIGFGMPMVDALYRKSTSPTRLASQAVLIDGWAQFPWEASANPEDAVVRLLQYLGEDPSRDGLLDTPKRVLKAFREMTVGMGQNPAEILKTQFSLEHDELVLVKGVPFTSLCEHHLLPFSGHAAVAYIPANGKIVGLSKLARLVECFARRPQVQERLTGQIADSIEEHLQPVGTACVISAQHSCMACRGVKLSGVDFVTSALRGVLKGDISARAELMALINK